MKILVVGAGIIGMTTAYYLARDGHQVTVVDRADAAGAETSFANGGQLSYSFVAPLAGPGVLSKVPGWLLDRNSPLRFRPRLDPNQWRWSAAFVLACNAAKSRQTAEKLLALSFLSRDLYHELAEQEGVPFEFARSGKLVMHREAKSFDDARAQTDYQATLGCHQEVLNADQCVAIEPALADVRGEIAGGIFTRSEDSGDCRQLCESLVARLRTQGVVFRFGANVTRLITRGDQISAVEVDGDLLEADAFVLATGVDAPRLTRPLGIRPLLYGLKGYSLTYPLVPVSNAPTVSVTDLQNKVVYARIGDRLRVAGIVDMGDDNTIIRPERIATLARQTEALFPRLSASGAPTTWAGLRPATPEGVPLIGPTRVRNLWMNIGHGALGFTLATGSAHLLAGMIAGRADERAKLFKPTY
ncbi:D-amino acid dehydrogenase [Pigmentiphaga aceris]|uniref:D-amino acid dehydrogenase n=1 Tax=Pigmentiphaga aceris TaxID=1940612 RepID=A0A5C0AU73_9BURK|nr:D-amino acid dehydrogenase [Pigmentiphaga aceris]QEI05959.1 D-amino acid dehydrogenase [Pigmentiphaga aceris]